MGTRRSLLAQGPAGLFSARPRGVRRRAEGRKPPHGCAARSVTRFLSPAIRGAAFSGYHRAVLDHAAQICEFGRRAYARSLIAGGEGNISVRIGPQRILCTPSGLCKGFLQPEDLCEVDLAGARLTGTRPPSSELPLHLEIYRAADEHGWNVGAVVHAHPPFATTFALLGETIPGGLLPEADIFLEHVPLVPYRTPGSQAAGAAIRPYVRPAGAALLQNHGAVTWGRDVGAAYMLMETLEAVCRVYHQARLIGRPQPIPLELHAELRAVAERYRKS